ncbi:hypothetical protein K435DRAFT_907761 [Dendrothele bispora CBS 962.96]|uniref:Uncharacterized protein n=1 Tax=Dendrothele bispora (strain CBS 962.96) TaxID=1314807 RepID=A0A4S8LQZ8_DENBC|nr:hypothetical protein K435DRAFT_907761 [Dendrothele bispora CBS 962.96]
MSNDRSTPEKSKPKQQTPTTSKQIPPTASMTRIQTASFMQGASQWTTDRIIDQQHVEGGIITGTPSRPQGNPKFFKEVDKRMNDMKSNSSNALSQQPAQDQASHTFFNNASQIALRGASVRFVKGNQVNLPDNINPEVAKVIKAGLPKKAE